MRILVVCSGNASDFDVSKHQAFIYDQVEALRQLDTTFQFDYFFVHGKGIKGYLSCLNRLKQELKYRQYDWVHAHVTTSSLLANLQRWVPVITTFHGSDINLPFLRIMSLIAELLSYRTIYISHQLVQKAIYVSKAKHDVIPCGVSLDLFMPRIKADSRRQLGLDSQKKYILFSSNFDNPVKNYSLAKAAIERLGDNRIELLELKNYSRQEVALLLTAVDVALLTSHLEGSPQFIKEALACNCPVVSTDVGDVKIVMGEVLNCYITSYDPVDVAEKIHKALMNTDPILSRDYIRRFDNRLIASQIRNVYSQHL